MGQVASFACAAAIALAACDSGVSVEVDVGATGATRVELFIASHDPCDQCGALAGPADDRPLAGSVFFRDPDATFAVDVNNGKATINLAPGSGDNDVRTIVIVGFDGAKKVVGASVLESFHVGQDAMRVLVSLEAANDKRLGPSPSPEPFRVELWRKQDQIACVGVERWDGGSLTVRKFVVPEDDPDCDDVDPALECRPFQYKANSPADETSYTCLERFPVGTGAACMLGGMQCIDGEGPATTCGPTPYCVPDAVCNTTCMANQPLCLIGQLAPASAQLAHIECRLPVAPDADGKLAMCDGISMLHVVMGPPFTNANRMCTDGRLANLAAPPLVFGSQVDVRMVGSMTSDKLQVQLGGGFHNACQFDLEISGTIDPALSSAVGLQPAAIDLALDNDQHLVLPVRFLPTSDCAAEPSCVAVYPLANGATQDSIVHCIE